jgi:ketosteroid isomerase-like protein
VTVGSPTDVQRRNLAVVERALETMESGDRDLFEARLEEIMHPDCEWKPLVVVVEGRSYRGYDGMRDFAEDFLGSFEVRYEDRTLRAIGERGVLLLATMKLRGRESGIDVSQEVGVLFELEDGRILNGDVTASHADALSAAEAIDA